MQTLETTKLEPVFFFNTTSKKCKFVKKMDLYIYYFPIIESSSGNFTNQISKIYFLPDTSDTLIDEEGDYFTVNVNYVDLTGEDSLATSKQSSAFFPVTLGSIFAPLFE